MPIDFFQPAEDDHRRFLISFLFNGSQDPSFPECAWRAYLDFSRTAAGIGDVPAADDLRARAHHLVETWLREAAHVPRPWNQANFDSWHRDHCRALQEHYSASGYASFTVGQAQKWINMGIKYALSLNAVGMLEIRHSKQLRIVAHAPLDDYVLSGFERYSPPRLGAPWSKISDYDVYLKFQHWIRDTFPHRAPLDVEFHLWVLEAARRRGRSVSA